MISATNATCEKCAKRKAKPIGICFPVEVSRLERAIGHTIHECDKCHTRYKLTNEGPLPVGSLRRWGQ